jgi:hypothetical protein
MSKRMGLFLGLVLTGLFSGGCIVGIGDSPHPKPTTGQELVDLKRAKDSGAISDAEYDAQKKRLLAR